MKFLVDAQLPARLSRLLAGAGHDAVHTSELPEGNRTTDTRITQLADSQDRIVVTKDRDFRDGHLLAHAPRRLLLVSTGNITNTALLALIETNLDAITGAFAGSDFAELGPASLVVHQCHQAAGRGR